MLNCTDLACVLHHHHFYAHLHHLKHHLQDDGDNSVYDEGSNIDNNDNTKPTINDTDSDLSSLSHVDAPNEVIYIVCGVVIAMLLVGVIIIIVAVTINKLRKRDETSSSVTTAGIEAQQQQSQPHCESTGLGLNGLQMRAPPAQTAVGMAATDAYTTAQDNNNISRAQSPQGTLQHNNNNNNNHTELHISEANNNGKACVNGDQVTFTRTSGIGPGSEWTFPPKAPVPNIYHCFNPDLLVAGSDKNGLKGFRKQFSGRFKRLVARKPDPVPVIPPELKPQLKTIYVY